MAIVGNAPATLDLVVRQGSDFALTLTVELDGDPFDFTGATVTAKMINAAGAGLRDRRLCDVDVVPPARLDQRRRRLVERQHQLTRRRRRCPRHRRLLFAMTLLATKGVVTTQEAADVAGRAPAELVAEAEAWAVVAAERAKPKR